MNMFGAIVVCLVHFVNEVYNASFRSWTARLGTASARQAVLVPVTGRAGGL